MAGPQKTVNISDEECGVESKSKKSSTSDSLMHVRSIHHAPQAPASHPPPPKIINWVAVRAAADEGEVKD